MPDLKAFTQAEYTELYETFVEREPDMDKLHAITINSHKARPYKKQRSAKIYFKMLYFQEMSPNPH